MSLRKILAILVLSIFLMTTFSVQGAIDTSNRRTPTTGTTGDIDWSYDVEKTDTLSDSASLSESRSFSNDYSNTREYNQTVTLIEGIQDHEIWYFRYINKTKADPKTTWTKETGFLTPKGSFRNSTGNNIAVHAWARYDNYEVWNDFAMAFAGLREKWLFATWDADNATVDILNQTTVPKKDWLNLEYGSADLNAYHIKYYDEAHLGGEVVFEELLIPYIVEVRIKTGQYQVSISETVDQSAELTGSYNFTGDFNLTRYGIEVLIRDGFNLAFGYYALKNVSVDYYFEGGFTLEGGLSLNRTIDMAFRGNGTPVDQWRRPIWWQTFEFVTNGRWSTKWNESGTLYGIGVQQAIVQAIHTRLSNETQPNLAIWGNYKPGYLLAYNDTDGDEILTAMLNDSQIVTNDALMALGVPEGCSIIGNHNYTDAIDAALYTKIGDTTLFDIDRVITHDISEDFSRIWGFDPTSVNITQPTVDFDWQTPVEDVDGKVTFNWTVNYNDMPVSWLTDNGTIKKFYLADASAAEDYAMDFSYNYVYVVDPINGEADLLSTYYNSGVTNADLLADLEGTSLATWKRDYFMTMTIVGDDADGAVSNETTSLEEKIGGTMIFAEQEFGGSKTNYTQGASEYESQTSTINLITGMGETHDETFNHTGLNPFVSPITRRIGDVLNKYTASALSNYLPNIAWYARENIVITSYPTWDASQSLNHDPTSSIYYKAVDRPTSTTTTTPTTPTTTPTTSTTSSSGTGTSPTIPTRTSGFVSILSLMALVSTVLVFYIRRRRR